MKFIKVITYAKNNDIEYSHEVENNLVRLFLDDNMMVLYKHGMKVMVELYINIFGNDGELMDLGVMTQQEVIGVIRGATMLS